MSKIKTCLLLSALIFSTSFSFANTAVSTKPVSETAAAQEVVTQQVNINTASAQVLTTLKGVGIKKAEAIIAWRAAHGEFKNIEQIMDVKGIGNAIFEANRTILTI